MNLQRRISDIEHKSTSCLSEQESLLLRYWHSYKEANLYYHLMVNCEIKTLQLLYAYKGKISAQIAVNLLKTIQKKDATKTFLFKQAS
jgi:hypothetical protein